MNPRPISIGSRDSRRASSARHAATDGALWEQVGLPWHATSYVPIYSFRRTPHL